MYKNFNNSRPRISPISYALRLIKIRMRSEKELIDKMTLKKYLASEIDETISKLKSAKLIDDKIFAEMWLRSQNITKPSGKKLLMLKMKRFGLAKDIVDQAFEAQEGEFDEATQAKRIIESKGRFFNKYTGRDRYEKMLALLLRRGFDYSLAKEAISKFDSPPGKVS